MGAKPTQVKAFRDSAGNIDYFVVSLDAGGFAIVAGDDLVEPIIAFAPQGTFDPSPQNPLYALLNRDVPGRLAEVRDKRVRPGPINGNSSHGDCTGGLRASRQRLQAVNAVPSTSVSSQPNGSDFRVEPLVQSKWGQGNEDGVLCYNYYTYYYPNYFSLWLRCDGDGPAHPYHSSPKARWGRVFYHLCE